MQIATVPMTRQKATEAGLRVVDDISPAPAKTTFQTNEGSTGGAKEGETSGGEAAMEVDDDEAAKRKPAAALTLEA